MITAVRGAVSPVAPDAVAGVGGVGPAVWAIPAARRTGGRGRLYASPAVLEDSLTLLGSADAWARGLFALLRAVSGVEPREALAQATLGPSAPRDALGGVVALLTGAPGVGCDEVYRPSLELRDTVDHAPQTIQLSGGGSFRDEAVEAPTSLGLAAQRAERAVDGASGAGAIGADWDAVPRGGLPALGPRR